MKLTTSKLKELIKETLIKINEEELRERADNYDKRTALEKYVEQLSISSKRDFNDLSRELKELFGWHDILNMLKEWEDKTHKYYKDLANFAMAYGLAEEELDIPAEETEEAEEDTQ